MPAELASATALVTGGASGLGAATARELLLRGADVAVLDLEAAAPAEGADREALRVNADVTDPSAVASAVADAVAALGSLRVAVCCHGVLGPGRILPREGELDVGGFAQTVGVNLIGTYNVLAHVAQRMSVNEPDDDGERGVIVLTASIAAYEGQIGQAGYSASKAGLLGLLLPAARDLAAAGIRVVAIAPGTFDTPMLAAVPAQAREQLGAQIPFPARLGRPAEFADLVCHIATNAAINGTTVRLDGAMRLPPR
jgi:NAD(P)-dependent dehydrogenase (short-subunit alcohol dehydrogenase family)